MKDDSIDTLIYAYTTGGVLFILGLVMLCAELLLLKGEDFPVVGSSLLFASSIAFIFAFIKHMLQTNDEDDDDDE